MSPARLLPALLLAVAALLAAAPRPSPALSDELVRATTHVSYDIRPDVGPVRVTWRVDLLNNDPRTTPRESGTIAFYDSYPLPILRGASDLSATSSAGAPLAVTLEDSSPGPLVTAVVGFDRMLFYQETYGFTLAYSLSAAREESLLVTPYYTFVPVIASGDDVTVEVATPAQDGWDVNLEPVDCDQSGAAFTCADSRSIYLAAFAEVSRPDATGNISLDLSLSQKDISLTITYFRGEEAWAQHLQDLLAGALPLIEQLYGFPYSGPFAVNVAERGRQVILGYEGLTACDAQTACDVAVSPIADDYTVLHEMAHLWSDIYDRRWLAEGFAEFIAHGTAARLTPGLLQGEPPVREASGLDLRLDDWGDVTSIIAASEEERLIEDAGYDLSLRFLNILEETVGPGVLQGVNAAIAAGGQRAESRLFMDVLEDTGGQNLDELFAQWVFPDSFRPTLDARRRARDRLAALTARAEAEGLSQDIPQAIQGDVAAWKFDEALAALDRAEAALATYAQVKDGLAGLRSDVEAADLAFPESIDAAGARWDFEAVRLSVAAASEALDAYTAARARVDGPRSLWERLGLLGSDPDGSLDEAAHAFRRGDFQAAADKADDAANAVDSASRNALIRLAIVLAVLAGVAAAVGAAIWASRRRPADSPYI